MKTLLLLFSILSVFVSVYAVGKNLDSTKKPADNIYMPVFSDGYVKFVDSAGVFLNNLQIKTNYDICNIVTSSGVHLKNVLAESSFRFHDGMVLIKKSNNFFWNFFNEYECYNIEGNVIFKIHSNAVGYFSEGLLPVLTTKQFLFYLYDYKYGYVNNKGDMIIPPIYDYAGPFTEGLAHVLINGQYGFIDKTGKIVIKPEYEAASVFSDSLAAVRINGKYGYINKTGAMIISPVFDRTWQFKYGRARVLVNNKYGFIDKTGKYIIEPVYEHAYDFSEGAAAVKVKGKYGFINSAGRYIIEPIYQDAGNFCSGLAPVAIGSKYGYINQKGEQVIPVSFQLATNFENGLGVVWKDGTLLYINSSGKIISSFLEGE